MRALEREVGVTLLARSTRQVRLTTAGQRFHEGCAEMVAAARRAGQALAQLRDAPVGELRMTSPAGFGKVVGEALAPVLARHRALQVHLLADDALSDLVGERIDLALRFGRLPDSNWVAQRLGTQYMRLCASPSYVAARGMPLSPDDLPAHDAIRLETGSGMGSGMGELALLSPGGQAMTVKPAWQQRLSSNNQGWVQQMCEAGLGVAVLAAHDAYPALREGRLVPVLPGWSLPGLPMYALTAQRGPQPAKVRVALDALTAHMAQWPAEVFTPSGSGETVL